MTAPVDAVSLVVHRDDLDPLLEAVNRGVDQMPSRIRRVQVAAVARTMAKLLQEARHG